jgi:hypothetical protein
MDTAHFMHAFNHVHFVTAFHPFEKTEIKSGTSDFALYHGNLAVGENNEAALYLTRNIFNDLPYKLIIAGKKPSAELIKAVKASRNVFLEVNLSHKEIQKLVADAQCNILPTFQPTGIKLKLISSLFCGRTCIVNSPMVLNTGLETLCVIADSPEEMKARVSEAMNRGGMDADEIGRRNEILNRDFSNKEGAKKIINCI